MELGDNVNRGASNKQVKHTAILCRSMYAALNSTDVSKRNTNTARTSPKYFIESFVSTECLLDPGLDEVTSPYNRVGDFVKRERILRSAYILSSGQLR